MDKYKGMDVCHICGSFYPYRCDRCMRVLLDTRFEPVIPTGSCGEFDCNHMGLFHLDKLCKNWIVDDVNGVVSGYFGVDPDNEIVKIREYIHGRARESGSLRDIVE